LLVRQRYKSFHLIFPKGEAKQKEMGHLHGERLADLPFPVEIKRVWSAQDKHCLITFIQSPAGLAIGFEILRIYQQ
jgi:hypothetical protein